MSETAQKTSKKTAVIIIIAVILLLAAGVTVFLLLNKGDSEPEPTDNGGLIQYEGGVINYEDAQLKYDEAQKKADEGMVAVNYAISAASEDGRHFKCKIKNPVRNSYDMYLNIYKDNTFEEQILLTGLIPPGSGIEEFESEIQLDPGEYESVLVMTLVEDDHTTLHAQSSVVLRLYVGQE